MPKVRVNAFSISADGFGAGPHQSLEAPLGIGGEGLHEWILPTNTFQKLSGAQGTTGVDDQYASRSFENLGAWILGRNMFAHSRGPWTDDGWQGWWGDEPPYHVPVFVLTNHPREPLEMPGGTTFHFVTGGIHEALDRAKEAAGDKDVRIGGGAATIRQYLEAGLIDSLHIVIAPVLLGKGEPLLTGLDMPALGYRVTESAGSEKALHVVFERA